MAVILRLAVVLGGMAIFISCLIGFFSKDPRYFRFAWQLCKFLGVLLLVILCGLWFVRLLLVPVSYML